MVRVRLLAHVGLHARGEEVDLDPVRAQRLITAGYAEAVATRPPPPIKPKRSRADESADAR